VILFYDINTLSSTLGAVESKLIDEAYHVVSLCDCDWLRPHEQKEVTLTTTLNIRWKLVQCDRKLNEETENDCIILVKSDQGNVHVGHYYLNLSTHSFGPQPERLCLPAFEIISQYVRCMRFSILSLGIWYSANHEELVDCSASHCIKMFVYPCETDWLRERERERDRERERGRRVAAGAGVSLKLTDHLLTQVDNYNS
jgi:hypothetical protein